MRVLFNADHGPSAGLGHLSRCLSLGSALEALGARASFVSCDDGIGRRLVTGNGFTVAGDDDPMPDVIVVDSYSVPEAGWRRFRRSSLVVALDDLGGSPPADLIVNGAAGVSEADYPGSEARLLLGPTYAPLRTGFAGVPARSYAAVASRVLVTLGAMEAGGLAERLAEAVAGTLPDASVDVVAGPYSGPIGGPGLTRVHYAPPDMRELMLGADIAIASGGQTACELAACGTPAVIVVTAENQRRNAEGLERLGAVRVAGDPDAPDIAERVSAEVVALSAERSVRERLGTAGRRVVDGAGAERIAKVIVEEWEKRR